MSDLQKIERKKMQERRDEIQEQAIIVQRRMVSRVTKHEENTPQLGHDRQEEGVDEEVSPMEEYLWIEQQESLQLEIHEELIPLSPINTST